MTKFYCHSYKQILLLPALTLLQTIQGVPKKPLTIENDLLLEFQWPSTLQVKSVKHSECKVHILSTDVLRN